MHRFMAVVLAGRFVLLSEKWLALSNDNGVVQHVQSPDAVFCWVCVHKPLGGERVGLSDGFPVLLGCGCPL